MLCSKRRERARMVVEGGWDVSCDGAGMQAAVLGCVLRCWCDGAMLFLRACVLEKSSGVQGKVCSSISVRHEKHSAAV